MSDLSAPKSSFLTQGGLFRIDASFHSPSFVSSICHPHNLRRLRDEDVCTAEAVGQHLSALVFVSVQTHPPGRLELLILDVTSLEKKQGSVFTALPVPETALCRWVLAPG